MKSKVVKSVAVKLLLALSTTTACVAVVAPQVASASVLDKRDVYTDGDRAARGQRDPYVDGARSVTDPRDPYTDGA